MAGVYCGVVGESEAVATVEPSLRASRRRRLELRPYKIVADAAVQPPLENDQKRKKLDRQLFLPVSSRDCVNAVQNSDTQKLAKYDGLDNEGLFCNGNVKLETESSVEGEKEWPKFGMASVCGRRRDMEDAVSAHPSFCKQSSQVQISPDIHFFGVFDGHGCTHVAMKCRDRFHEILKDEVEACGGNTEVEWKQTMQRSFKKMDEEVKEWTVDDKNSSTCRCELQSPQCDAVGSTAVVAVVTPNKIIIANCGDSRAVLCRNGAALPLSDDHKPDRPDELLRIQEAGGRVIYWDGPRVLGVLAMSRAIGDNYLKPFVIPEPEVTITERKSEDECLILASDGLWDVVTNDTACGVARMCLRAERPPSAPRSVGKDAAVKGGASEGSDKACWDASVLLTKLALARHSTDNVSVVVVDLKKNQQQH
ncbi:ABA-HYPERSENSITIVE GERMINATION 3, ARABIDOPSIS THALIANA PROTEIN PHOSPHATASE 2CA [Hibiscus trionum]|uniref:protein-serine/threonine phosphatase n=1 Tax=Hibiscus trionum TaxID=183268 RepID=A0A9W7JC26_HIBTR|nr:ABA-HYPERSENSITIVE GERMINATION 3, ARABIDOPSIS THALIANA PROTEIN PHOSPHATASE 2CA [Hibiscus trionum]